MAKLSNKQHETQQDRRLTKLENYTKQDKKEMVKLKKRITSLEKQVKNLKKKK